MNGGDGDDDGAGDDGDADGDDYGNGRGDAGDVDVDDVHSDGSEDAEDDNPARRKRLGKSPPPICIAMDGQIEHVESSPVDGQPFREVERVQETV